MGQGSGARLKAVLSLVEQQLEWSKQEPSHVEKSPFQRVSSRVFTPESCSLVMLKSPTQEEYIRGSLGDESVTLQSIWEAGRKRSGDTIPVQALDCPMRAVRDYICLRLGLHGLQEDDFGLQLLVDGRMVPLAVRVADVFTSRERRNHTMTVVYRLAGLDGEPTEEVFQAPRDAEADASAARIVDDRTDAACLPTFLRCAGMEALLQIVHAVPASGMRLIAGLWDSAIAHHAESLSSGRLEQHLLNAVARLTCTVDADRWQAADRLLDLMESHQGHLNAEAHAADAPWARALTDEARTALARCVGAPASRLSLEALPTQHRQWAQTHPTLRRELVVMRALGSCCAVEQILSVIASHVSPMDATSEAYPCPGALAAIGYLLQTTSRRCLLPLLCSRGVVVTWIASIPRLHRCRGDDGSSAHAQLLLTLRLLQTSLARGDEATVKHIAEMLDDPAVAETLVQLERHASAVGVLAEDICNKGMAGRTPGSASIAAARQRRLEARRRVAACARLEAERRMQALTRPERLQQLLSQHAVEGSAGDADRTALRCVVCGDGHGQEAGTADGLLTAYVYNVVALLQPVSMTPALPLHGTPNCHRPVLLRVCSTTSHFHLIHEACHRQAALMDCRRRVPRSEWEGAALRNSCTRANCLLPLWGGVDHIDYARLADAYLGHLAQWMAPGPTLPPLPTPVSAAARDPAKVSAVQKLEWCFAALALSLWRFAASPGGSNVFAVESGGGGYESNAMLLPHQVALVLWCVRNAGNSGSVTLTEDASGVVAELVTTSSSGLLPEDNGLAAVSRASKRLREAVNVLVADAHEVATETAQTPSMHPDGTAPIRLLWRFWRHLAYALVLLSENEWHAVSDTFRELSQKSQVEPQREQRGMAFVERCVAAWRPGDADAPHFLHRLRAGASDLYTFTQTNERRL
ncbi:hypothetical protein CDCA_CDCA04G1246 [Cyanidium caldarium]|uniref:E3 ubiquitin ligase UBR4 C-terminal domain-containing protein n=1 Tax=Cyanidium caldarium TaxID=2771 RepID=A0AAV9ISR4_CYACA|nr:hypothetical protein CDCA_CDCA04G1246 [Cyanidium caldarium]